MTLTPIAQSKDLNLSIKKQEHFEFVASVYLCDHLRYKTNELSLRNRLNQSATNLRCIYYCGENEERGQCTVSSRTSSELVLKVHLVARICIHIKSRDRQI